MEIIRFPQKAQWPEIKKRPVQKFEDIRSTVKPVLDAVRREGDAALRRYTREFDRANITDFRVSEAEIRSAREYLEPSLKEAIEKARINIFTFHRAQIESLQKITTAPGVVCWRKSVAIESVGLYIPGGTSPLFSTVLMLGIPAQIAGCTQVILCTPPNPQGHIDPVIIYAADVVGIRRIYKAGGAQAIAAMAYGTETIPAVHKIFGPGNQYVTAAKQIVSQEGIAIDMPAGPSEVAILADASANPEFIAADLLSQAEHGVDSQVLLATTEADLIEAVQSVVEKQLTQLPRREVAAAALQNSKLILLKSRDDALSLINFYAPEHLILMVEDPEAVAEKVINAGSVFLGHYTPEAAGDYASGTNHTLPTNGFAAAYSGISVDSFVKKITFQQISEAGLRVLGPVVERLAEAEGLAAHKQAVSIRLNAIGREEV